MSEEMLAQGLVGLQLIIDNAPALLKFISTLSETGATDADVLSAQAVSRGLDKEVKAAIAARLARQNAEKDS